MLKAVTRQAAAVDAKVRALNGQRGARHDVSTAYYFDHYATPDDIAVMVTEADFMAAHEELIPSVSAGELAHYERVRAMFEGVGDGPGAADAAAPAGGGGLAGAPLTQSRVSSSASTARPGRGRGKGKGKGKGKAVALTSDDEFDDTEGEGANGTVNGRPKGKGKAVAGFQDTASDDGLY